MVKKRACIFISGYGSNLKALIQNSRDHNFPVKISLVIKPIQNYSVCFVSTRSIEIKPIF